MTTRGSSRQSSLRQGPPGANGRWRRTSTIYEEDDEDEDAGYPPTSGIKAGHRAVSGSSYASNRQTRMAARRSTLVDIYYDVPDEYANLAEVADVFPVQPDEGGFYRFKSLEESRSQDQEEKREKELRNNSTAPAAESSAKESKESNLVSPSSANQGQSEGNGDGGRDGDGPRGGSEGGSRLGDHVEPENKVSKLATQIYTTSYVVFFSLFGTMARVGLSRLTTFPGTPIAFTSLWPNFAGSVVMGFLIEDRMLFRSECRISEVSSMSGQAAARRSSSSAKKTIPMYIGLASGFCGSFTSFSAFMRDVAEATSNDLTYPHTAMVPPRNAGYSVMATLSVLLVTISLSIGGLFVGAHLAIALEPVTPSLPYLFTRKLIDRLTVLAAWSCWAAAIVFAAWPYERDRDNLRGSYAFALVFSPAGALARFYASLHLNGRIASFPLGTFVVNVGGTALLGMAWDMAHAGHGGMLGCQVLQGFEDGFCGCLTTVSTWVAELTTLRRSHAYTYGGLSVLSAYALLVAMVCVPRWMLWKDGFPPLLCAT